MGKFSLYSKISPGTAGILDARRGLLLPPLPNSGGLAGEGECPHSVGLLLVACAPFRQPFWSRRVPALRGPTFPLPEK